VKEKVIEEVRGSLLGVKGERASFVGRSPGFAPSFF
jgi:hypothetical protein